MESIYILLLVLIWVAVGSLAAALHIFSNRGSGAPLNLVLSFLLGLSFGIFTSAISIYFIPEGQIRVDKIWIAGLMSLLSGLLAAKLVHSYCSRTRHFFVIKCFGIEIF